MTRVTTVLLCCLAFSALVPRTLLAADGLALSGVALTPQSRVIPGRVMVLLVTVGNTGDQAASGRLSLTIDEIPNLQSARQVALEPGQREQYELFFPLPEELATFDKIHVVTTLFGPQGDNAVILQRKGAPAVSTLTLPVTSGDVFGMVVEPDPPMHPNWSWPRGALPTSYELATAARIDAGGQRLSATYDNQPLPLNQVQWNGIDLFIITGPSALEDPAAVETLRKFINRGGRLWVMLDKVPSRLVRPLLGSNQSCEEVERVELNEFIIEIDSPVTPLLAAERHIQPDHDIPMTRVVQSGGKVTHSIEGWPVSIAMDIGYGQLLLTTLDSQVWIEPRPSNNQNADPLLHTAEQTRPWARTWAVDANQGRVQPPLSRATQYPMRLIGNPVVPKSWVAVALLGFCAVLACMGLGLSYAGRLTALGLQAPAIALVASLSLLLAASWIRRDIPESVSRLQMVDIDDDGTSAVIREQAAVYLSTAANMQLNSEVEGIVRSSKAITSGVRRLVFEDHQQWHLANPAWPPGAWRYAAEYMVPTTDLIVEGFLTPEGLELIPPNDLPSNLQDPVLNFVTSDPVLCQPSDRGLRVDEQVTPGAGRWISGALISDEQQRRQEIYDDYFDSDAADHRPARRLLGWTEPWPGANWTRDLQQQGAALVSLPVRLRRPSIGQEVSIPHGLLQLRRDQSEGNVTSIFDDRSGQWRKEIVIASQADMELLLPTEVVPLEAESIRFELDMIAPQRVVRIDVKTATGPVELVKLDNPSVPWSQTITDPAILQTIREGRLRFTIRVSDLKSAYGGEGATSVVTWHIDHFHASVRGRIVASSTLSAGP